MKAKLGMSTIVNVLTCLGIDATFIALKDAIGKGIVGHEYLTWYGEKTLERWFLILRSDLPTKKFHVHGMEKDLRGLIYAVDHDVKCGCESCIGWLTSTIKDNAVPSKDCQNEIDYLSRIKEDIVNVMKL